MLTLDLGVNDDDPTMDNVSQEPEGFVDEEANLNPVDGVISQTLFIVLQRVLEANII